MRYLSAIVEVSALAVLDARQDLALGRGVALELVCHDHPRSISQALQQLAKEPLGCGRVAPALDQDVEDISVLIDRTPKIVLLAADADGHLASRAEESHPHALPEPYVTLSSHTAPDVRPFACRN